MKNIIIDFDSTFISIEALDKLAEIALKNNKDKDQILDKIQELTNLGMNGDLSFSESLKERLNLITLHQEHIDLLIKELHNYITPSFQFNREFIQNYTNNIYIISSGFIDYILPIVKSFGILETNVYANNFIFDENGNVIGFDETNLLSQDKGKVKVIEKLNLIVENSYIIGDGYTDYQVREFNKVKYFFAFGENIKREKILQKADYAINSFDEFLQITGFIKKTSYPKNKIKILLLENVHHVASNMLKEEGFYVETFKGSMNEDELCEIISDVSVLGIRSKTQITKKVLESAKRLMAIGTFCIGTNQVDLLNATKRGVSVFNAPYSNTRSVVEMVIGQIIILLRKIIVKNNNLHQGVWDKSANNCYEIRGKKLGIIGYGNIGSQLSVLAESLGMNVYYYDINEKLALGNAKKCISISELLSISDIVTLHVDGRSINKNLISKIELDLMKEHSILINLSRGHVVDIDALVEKLNQGKFLGVALDVFPYEPLNNNEEFISQLRGIDRVILTPHIGGSTEEAQYNIGDFVARKIINYINSGDTMQSINIPNMQLPILNNAHRIIHIHENIPGILAQMNHIFAKHNINILWQSLRTNESIGYIIADINKNFDYELLEELKQITHTIKFRVLY
jgi:D-3-phosphoglycerate dehydrogenase